MAKRKQGPKPPTWLDRTTYTMDPATRRWLDNVLREYGEDSRRSKTRAFGEVWVSWITADGERTSIYSGRTTLNFKTQSVIQSAVERGELRVGLVSDRGKLRLLSSKDLVPFKPWPTYTIEGMYDLGKVLGSPESVVESRKGGEDYPLAVRPEPIPKEWLFAESELYDLLGPTIEEARMAAAEFQNRRYRKHKSAKEARSTGAYPRSDDKIDRARMDCEVALRQGETYADWLKARIERGAVSKSTLHRWTGDLNPKRRSK